MFETPALIVWLMKMQTKYTIHNTDDGEQGMGEELSMYRRISEACTCERSEETIELVRQ